MSWHHGGDKNDRDGGMIEIMGTMEMVRKQGPRSRC